MLDHHYDGLTGDWAEYAEVAQKFVRARLYTLILPEDAEDLTQHIILTMAEVGRKMGREPGGWLWKTAHYELLHYWRERAKWPLLSLNHKQDGNGKGRELWETLAAPDSDLDAQLDASMWLERCGPRILGIARKMMIGETLTEAERGYLHWWRRRMGIATPRSGHKMMSSQAHEVSLPPLKVTVYKAICVVLERSPTPLHERVIARLVAATYPPLAETIKGFHRQVHTTLCKRQRNGVCERVAPATWRFNGKGIHSK
ncbi:MAG: hypothetical protein V3U31_08865 [Dehalococcoidia bacterium]